MIEAPVLQQHHGDPSLHITHDHHFNGMPLQWQQGPFFYGRLQRINQAIQEALDEHGNVMAMRVSLVLPVLFTATSEPYSRQTFSRFIRQLVARVKTQLRSDEDDETAADDIGIHYFWLREINPDNEQPCYRCVLLFGEQIFDEPALLTIGSSSLCGQLNQAWANALRIDSHLCDRLVELPDEIDWINRDEGYNDFFRGVSCLAKVSTSGFGSSKKNFGASSRRCESLLPFPETGEAVDLSL